jgi:hypothetical protein
MAIQPIDLQTLFTQLDKVGKSQSAQKEGLAVQQALQNVHLQKKTEEAIRSINEVQNTGEGAEKINDQGARKNNEPDGQGRDKKKSGEAEDGQEESVVIQDPALGRNIDISG